MIHTVSDIVYAWYTQKKKALTVLPLVDINQNNANIHDILHVHTFICMMIRLFLKRRTLHLIFGMVWQVSKLTWGKEIENCCHRNLAVNAFSKQVSFNLLENSWVWDYGVMFRRYITAIVTLVRISREDTRDEKIALLVLHILPPWREDIVP